MRLVSSRMPSSSVPEVIRALPTNLGDAMEEVVLRVNVWHDDYETARAIVEQVHVALDRATLTLDGGQVARISSHRRFRQTT